MKGSLEQDDRMEWRTLDFADTNNTNIQQNCQCCVMINSEKKSDYARSSVIIEWHSIDYGIVESAFDLIFNYKWISEELRLKWQLLVEQPALLFR